MEKKGQVGTIVFVALVGIILIAIVITAVVIAVGRGGSSQTEVELGNGTIELFIKAEESMGGGFIADFIVFSSEWTRLGSGKTSAGAYTPIKIPLDDPILVACSSSEHYTGIVKKSFTQIERTLNKSKVTCTAERGGALKIDRLKGTLSDLENEVQFNISAEGGAVQRISVCVSWSPGIIDVKADPFKVPCSTGVWRNYTKFYDVNQTYLWLPQGQYLCGETWLEHCDSAVGPNCILRETAIPQRFSGKVDKCFDTGISLSNKQSSVVTFRVLTLENKNQLDNVKFIFYDNIQYYDSVYHQWRIQPELNGKDVGIEDVSYDLAYSPATA